MSENGRNLVMEFPHEINAERVILKHSPVRKGNTLNQVGQVMDELVEKERERIIAIMTAWDGNELVLDARGNYVEEALREAFRAV